MGILQGAASWFEDTFGRKERVIRRYPLPAIEPARRQPPPPATEPNQPDHVTQDDVSVHLEGLTISVQRKIDLPVPFEVTVVVPRAEVTETYSGGELVQRIVVYSSITVAHSPRFEGLHG